MPYVLCDTALAGWPARKQPGPVRTIMNPLTLRAAHCMKTARIQIDEQQIFAPLQPEPAWKKLLVHRELRPLKVSVMLHLLQHIPAGQLIAVGGMHDLQPGCPGGISFRVYINVQQLVFKHKGRVDAGGRLVFDEQQLTAVTGNAAGKKRVTYG
ncbi:hypothetical protein D3C73_1362670 [compost metagenome]